MDREEVRNRIENWSEKVPESGCWIWTGCTNDRGYGNMTINSKHWRANRASWEAFVGLIPEGLHVCHKCDVRCCVNPDHLFLGTHQENIQDREAKGRNKVRWGEDHPLSVVTEDDIREIRRLAKEGVSKPELAERFGTEKSNVYLIVSRKTWKHVD